MKARSDELQIFVCVIECGSISAAAEQVGQTPSAVSRT
ncbi:LysR family transcriptional regulator, partial [Pseudoalteromonas sp. CAL107-MNA-CIBAN-0098]